jgi:hypothetical protein
MDDTPGRLDIEPKVGKKWEIRIESQKFVREVGLSPGFLFRKKKPLCVKPDRNTYNVGLLKVEASLKVQEENQLDCLFWSFIMSSLSTTEGFHTTWTTTVNLARDADKAGNCSLFVLYHLPPHIFVDPYELANFKDSYTFQLSCIQNLELPVTALLSPGSNLLLNVSLESMSESGDDVSVDVPLHLRYGKPGSLDYHQERIPSPTAYIACPVNGTHYSFPLCYFLILIAAHSQRPDVPTQFLSYFESRSVSVVPPPAVDSYSVIRIPVGRPEHLPVVEIGTTGVILFAFILILRTSLRVATRLARTNKQSKVD